MEREPHILVVDDQHGVRHLIREVFAKPAYRVSIAANGVEALATARRDPPDVVLLDVKMPVMDGVEALRLLKQLQPRLLCVMMTAVDDGEQIRQALMAGAQACVTKPFDVFGLRDLVESLLRKEGTR